MGKDLSRICLPVYFNEPLSALQRIAEEMEYSELIDMVSYLGDPVPSLKQACLTHHSGTCVI